MSTNDRRPLVTRSTVLLRSGLRFAIVVFAFAVGAGCHDGPTTPHVLLASAAGIYELQTAIGRGPVSGTFTLSANGQAVRRVRFVVSSQVENVSTGSFTIDANGISFLLTDTSSPAYAWPVRGEWRGTSFTIRYPDPADGPDIVETYRRRLQ
jgi:hypothetical protein